MSARASNPSQMEDILSRMEALETASKNMREEMFSLQKENIVLRSDLLKGQRENLDLKKDLQTLQQEVRVVKRRVNDGKKIETALKAGEKRLEDKITHLENVCRVLNRAMAEGHDNKDIKEEVTELSDRLATMDYRVSPLENKIVSLEDRTSDLESKQVSLGGRTRVLENKVAPLQGRTAGLEKKLAPLEKRNSDVVKSQVKVVLNTRNGRLVTGRTILLSKCVHVWTNGGCLDTSSGRVKLCVLGNYLVHFRVIQSGEGKIDFSLFCEDDMIGEFGQTQMEYPVLSSTIALTVEKTRTIYWVEAFRLEGEATIDHCSLYVQLLADMVESQVRVGLNTENGKLITGQYITLSKCVKVRTNGGCLDDSSGVLRLDVVGNYLLHLRAQQSGEGKIEFSLKREDGICAMFGQTRTEYPFLTSTIALNVGKLHNWTIEVKRLEGDATIKYCTLYVTLMGYR